MSKHHKVIWFSMDWKAVILVQVSELPLYHSIVVDRNARLCRDLYHMILEDCWTTKSMMITLFISCRQSICRKY